MVPLTREQLAGLRHWFLPERPGPLIAQHLIATGNGRCLADRWPGPGALVVETGGNYTLAGDPGALDPQHVLAPGRYGTVTYSPKVFIPVTRLCRDRCHYCTFATVPHRLPAAFLERDEVLDRAWSDVDFDAQLDKLSKQAVAFVNAVWRV